MMYWAGVALFLMAAWLVHAGYAHRRRVRAERTEPTPAAETTNRPNPIAILGDVLPPLIVMVLVVFSLKIPFAYVVLDHGRYVSPFDLAGLLAFPAGYGTWLILKTRYRRT